MVQGIVVASAYHFRGIAGLDPASSEVDTGLDGFLVAA